MNVGCCGCPCRTRWPSWTGRDLDAKTIVGLRTVGTKTARRIAEDVVRQRLLMEGYYRLDVDEAALERYFAGLSDALALRMYGKPTIFSTGGQGKERTRATTRLSRS
jgi:hypothetical protein